MNRYSSRFSKRSGMIDISLERPLWQQKRGKRYGNNRKQNAYLKWKWRKQQRQIEKKIHEYGNPNPMVERTSEC